MSYGSISLDPVETRVTLGSAAMPSSSLALRPESRARPEPRVAHDRRGDSAVAMPSGDIDLSVLSPASLRAQAVTGMLEARRSDLARADRALAEPIAAARRSLGGVWPPGADTNKGTQPAVQDKEAVGTSVEPMSEGEPAQARGELARAVQDVQRLAGSIAELRQGIREGVDTTIDVVNDLAGLVGELNARIEVSAPNGRPAVADLARRRDQLILTLGRLAGGTAQPGAGSSLTVLVDGRNLVAGTQTAPLTVLAGDDGDVRLTFGDGRAVAVSAGVLASRLGTLNKLLPALADTVQDVLGHLARQATAPTGPRVDGGPEVSAKLGGLLRELSRAAESSSAYARVSIGADDAVPRAWEDVVGAARREDLPSAGHRPDLFLGIIEGPEPRRASSVLAQHLGAMRAALGELAHLAGALAAPGATTATTTIVSGAPGIGTPVVAPGAPAGIATLRVLARATGAVVGTIQTFHPDSPLGDGRERILGIVTQAGTAQERTTLVDVGTYPTPADLATIINQANAGVHATLAKLTGGTVQVRLSSLTTGRGQDITICNGSLPPTVSTVLGRVVTLSAPRDTVVEVQRDGQATVLAQGSGHVVRDVLPGVDVRLRTADPSRTFQVGVRWRADHAVDLTARTVAQVATALAASQLAGAPATADNVMGALGLSRPTGAGLESTERPVPGAAAVPGARLDRHGRPVLDRDALVAAFGADPAGTAQALTAMARRLTAVAVAPEAATWEAYSSARAITGFAAPSTYAPPEGRRADRDASATIDLSRREQALLAVLARLQDQGDWLGRQLGSTPA